MIDAPSYVRRETIVSVAINSAISLLFFWLAFGRVNPVPTWGFTGYVGDFIPQGFMVAFMATLVPGALAAKAVRSGRVAASAKPPPPVRTLLFRGVATGIAAAALGSLAAGVVLGALDMHEVGWWSGLAGKILFGGGLAALVTPIALRAVLARP